MRSVTLGADGLQARLNHPLDLPSLSGPDSLRVSIALSGCEPPAHQ